MRFVRFSARLVRVSLPSLALIGAGALVGASSSAGAYPFGPGAGYDGEHNSCKQCHTNNAGPAPTIAVAGLDGPFTAGDVAHLTLTVTGVQDGAGFEVGTDGDSGGTFDLAGASGMKLIASNKQVEHSTPQNYDANHTATWSFDLTVAGGDHTLFVAANDVHIDNNSSDDHVGLQQFTFSVTPGAGGEGEGEGAAAGEGEGSAAGEGEGSAAGEGEGSAAAGEGEGEGGGVNNAASPGGCSATTTSAGIPALGFVALVFGASRLRRRRR